MGSALLAAAFRLQLAAIYSRQGSVAVAQLALGPVADLLAARSAGRNTGGGAAVRAHLSAQHAVVKSRLAAAASDLGAAWEHAQAAIELCGSQEGAEADPWLAADLPAVHASALLAGAECRAAQGDASATVQLAAEALEVLGSEAAVPGGASSCGGSGGSSVQLRAAALLLLALHEPGAACGSSSMGREGLCIWGLQPPEPAAAEGAAKPAAAKKPAARGGRGRAAAAAAAGKEAPGAPAEGAGGQLRVRQLWQAYWLAREVPHLYR